MRKFTLTITLLLICLSAIASEEDPGFPGGDPDVPIDGGIGFMLMIGALYGIKKLRAANKETEEDLFK